MDAEFERRRRNCLPPFDGVTIRVERITRRAALSPDWTLFFRLMKTLAEGYDDNNVRLVVWFDR